MAIKRRGLSKIEPSISASWLLNGHFDFSAQDPRHTITQLIKAHLCASLSLPKDGLRIASYPVGAAWRHIFWWREGNVDYAEAQFFAEVSETHPVLSLGVAVEKGLEERPRRPEELMDRATWDWSRLVVHLPVVLSTDVVAAAAGLRGSINVRIRSKRRVEADTEATRETRAFSFVDGGWFERNVGRVEPDKISEYVRDLDGQRDLWVILHFARDLGPAEADGLAASGAAALLMAFDGIRRRLRP
jgi:hypothetical protein